MRTAIPSVKQWVVTGERGWKWLVLGPTRYLALLNFRHDYGYLPVKSIGLSRKSTVKN